MLQQPKKKKKTIHASPHGGSMIILKLQMSCETPLSLSNTPNSCLHQYIDSKCKCHDHMHDIECGSKFHMNFFQRHARMVKMESLPKWLEWKT